jgi:hypothetical protein
MRNHERELARACYGYGRWKAPYWFIGLEEGMAPSEKNNLTKRARAFRDLNRGGLCDCRRFHEKIGVYRWHEPNSKTGQVRLQSTWKYLILLLMAFRGDEKLLKEYSRRTLQRAYQSGRWGMAGKELGETCVIELSGLPANNLNVSRRRSEKTQRLLEEILPTRIGRIRKGIIESEPKFVVMYGITAKKHWDKIAGLPLQADTPKKVGHTTYLLVRHPTARFNNEKKDQYWIRLGTELRSQRP